MASNSHAGAAAGRAEHNRRYAAIVEVWALAHRMPIMVQAEVLDQYGNRLGLWVNPRIGR